MKAPGFPATLLAVLLGLGVPAAYAHLSVEEELADRCGDAQAKAFGRYQGCIFVALVRKRAKPEFDLPAAQQKCGEKAADMLTRFDERYSLNGVNYCPLKSSDPETPALINHLLNRVTCVAQFFMDGDDSCFP